ncbi:MAG: hypothetical protein KGJ77_04130 [Acidobacteriota bacterium]|nr:hypothetical protein [Acidobacteriota bacterium]
MHRKLLLGLAATVFSSVIGVGGGVVSQAAGASVNHFKGNAPGAVTCFFQLNIRYKRGLHALNPSITTQEHIAAHATSCVTDESANPGITVGVLRASVPGIWVTPGTGILPDGAYTCGVGFGGGQVSSGWTFKWQGASLTGTVGGVNFQNAAQFATTTVSPITGTIAGNQLTLSGMTQTGGPNTPVSFQGTVSGTLTQSLPSTPLATLCARGFGFVQFSGNITIGG